MIRADTKTPVGDSTLPKSTPHTSNTNPIKEITNILESEGPGSLFSGLLPRAVRALTSGGIQFASYELTQNALLNR
jgi:Mitochondrial carrier protein